MHLRRIAVGKFCIAQKVGDMDRRAFESYPPNDRSACRADRMLLMKFFGFRGVTIACRMMVYAILCDPDARLICAAQSTN